LANQIIWRALVILETLSFRSNLQDKITRLKAHFPLVKQIPIQAAHFAQLSQNRKLAPYTKALQIAQMIILNYSPDIKTGQEHMLTLLFDMNKLWEEYIYQMLLCSKRADIKVHFQNQQKFWENRLIKPDLVIEQQTANGCETFVIDTKWKILDTQNPRPSDDDLKQMYVYNLYWNAQRSMLLYPSAAPTQQAFGNYLKGREKTTLNQCKVGFVNVINEDTRRLDLKVGDAILDQLLVVD
jgi:5-methylcytosine-specific restriction enzyme subunit McrC